MASALKFRLGGVEFESVPTKVERKKLYGFTDVVATDRTGAVCTTAQVDPDGELLIPPGSIKSGLIDADGAWCERSELVAVDSDGKELPIVPSSFGQTIELSEKVTDEVFLDHVWKSVYQLDSADLAKAVGKDIYSFVFNYRADASAGDGYLVSVDDKVFLFDGEKLAFEYIGISEESILDDPAEETAAEDEDLDFSMM
ncbi:MAG: hypothetical protein WCJ02_16875 [bacterium]